METTKEEEPQVFLDRASRVTRGKRMNKFLGEEIEEDELFWNQDALKEEENDEEYQEEGEVADEFDSDFNDDEPEPDEEAINDVDDRVPSKKRLIFPGKSLSKKKKKKKKKKDLLRIEKTSLDEKPNEQSGPPENPDAADDAEGERTVRKSTRTSVIVRQAERDAIRAALQATMKPIKRKKEGEEKRVTQEEMLLEAAQTEIMNLRNLERVLAREEEVKKRAVVNKAVYTGPQMRYVSKNGHSHIEFSKGLSFDSEIMTKSAPYPEKAVCVVTGLSAKYRDPKTGLPFATKEAFRIIRERYADENNNGQSKMDMGNLLESAAGQGFIGRRKRSMKSTQDEISCARSFARFRRIPAFDEQDSD
ncbi:hypothetical protein Ancab_015890 [Ancistrocladus abbreviatus]